MYAWEGEIESEGVEGSSEVYHHQSVGIISYSRDEAVVPDVTQVRCILSEMARFGKMCFSLYVYTEVPLYFSHHIPTTLLTLETRTVRILRRALLSSRRLTNQSGAL